MPMNAFPVKFILNFLITGAGIEELQKRLKPIKIQSKYETYSIMD